MTETRTPTDEASIAESAGDHGIGPSYRLLDSIEERYAEDELKTLRRQLRNACKFFPRLAPITVTVGCRTAPGSEHSRWTPYASAEPINYFIRLPTEERPSNQTIFHELAHLEIYERDRFTADLPTSSEEFCSIYTVARMPSDLIYREDISYLGMPDAPPDEWPEICRRGLAYREEHGANSHYIRKTEEWLGV